MWHAYPYTDAHELNLDWILTQIKSINVTLSNFIVMNTIKYADPFQWDITTQYESNTIVMEPNTGVAYISTKPVPAGISISNTDFWTPVFDLSQMFSHFDDNITFNNEYLNIVSTHVYPAGSWLIWKNELYLVTSNINLGDALQPGTNMTRKSVEELVDSLSSQLDTFISYVDSRYLKTYTTVADLIAASDLSDGDYAKTLGYDAAGDDGGALYHISSATPLGYYETLASGLYAEIIIKDYVTPKMFGAAADGVTDDSAKLNLCVSSLPNGGTIYIPQGTYLITDHFVVNKSNIRVTGVKGASVIKVGAWVDGIRVSDDSYPATTEVIKNIEISNLTIDGNRNGYVNGPNDTHGNGINLNSVNDVIVKDCIIKDVAEQSLVETFWESDPLNPLSQNIIFDGNVIYNPNTSRIAIGCEGRFKNGTVVNNSVYGSGNFVGIEISNNGGGTHFEGNNTIRGNHLVNTTQNGVGIHMGEAQGDNVIDGNIVSGFEFGIRLGCDTGDVGDALIANNTLKNFGYGGVMIFPINNTNYQGSVSDNIIFSDQTSNSSYVLVTGGGYVRDNTVIVRAGDCKGIETSAGCTVEGNTILHQNSATGYALSTTATGSYFADNRYDNNVDIASGNILKNNLKTGADFKNKKTVSLTLDSAGTATITDLHVADSIVTCIISASNDHVCNAFINSNDWLVRVTDTAGTPITGSESVIVFYENRALYQ